MVAPQPPMNNFAANGNQDQFPANPPILQNPVITRSPPSSTMNGQVKQNFPNVNGFTFSFVYECSSFCQ